MEKKTFPLPDIYRLLETGPVVLVTTAYKGKSNIMTQSWHTMMEFEPPLIAECFANLECRVVDTRMVNRYNFFVLEVVKAWVDPARKDQRTLHYRGKGSFMVAGKTIRLRSRMK